MTGLERIRVSEVLRLERRQVDVEPSGRYEEIGVRSFGRGIFHKEPVDGIALGSKRVFRVEPGDLVISNVFAWEGAIAVASEAEAGKIGSHRFMTFVPVDGRIETSWAAWFFRSEPGLALIRKASPGSAGRNKTLAVKRFEDLVIPLPPIDVQRHVAARLDGARASSQHIARLADRSNDLSAAFPAACASAQHLTLHQKLECGWRSERLGELMTQSEDRVSVQPDTPYPNLGIYSFGRGVFEKPPIEGDSTSATSLFRVRAGQFIYSRLFAFEGAYATVPDRFEGYFVSNEFPSFDVDPRQLDPRWLAAYLRSPGRWTELASTSIGLGVRRQRVPVESILSHEVLVPPLAQQEEMVRSIERVDAIRVNRSRSDARLAAIVPSLLNQEFASLG